MEISAYSADDDAPKHTHTYTRAVIQCCVMIVQGFFFSLILMQSERHLLIYLFQRMSDKAFQVYERGDS